MYLRTKRNKGDSRQMTNEVRFGPNMAINPLGRIILIGFRNTDFQDGVMTLQQFVKMPRIFIKK